MDGGLNTYAYVGGNPITRVDEKGLFSPYSPHNYIQSCARYPSSDDRCECLCQLATNYEACVKKCKDGCLSPKKTLSPKNACMCTCIAAGYEKNVCKRGCNQIVACI